MRPYKGNDLDEVAAALCFQFMGQPQDAPRWKDIIPEHTKVAWRATARRAIDLLAVNWFPVSQQLPPEHEDILLACEKNALVCEGYYIGWINGEHCWKDMISPVIGVTHWAYPPKFVPGGNYGAII